MFILSLTFSMLLLLASEKFIVANQTEQLQVNIMNSTYPIVIVKTQTGCNGDNQHEGQMELRVHNCSNKNRKYSTRLLKSGVCKDGVRICISPLFRDDRCAVIKGKMGALEYQSPELNLTNKTFYNRTDKQNVECTTWMHRGNTSEIRLKPVAGVPVYKLWLEAVKKKNTTVDCGDQTLTGEAKKSPEAEESPMSIIFTAHWQDGLIPNCTYRVWFRPMDECGTFFLTRREIELPGLEYKSHGEEQIMLKPKNKTVYVATIGTLAIFLLVIMVLLLFVRPGGINKSHVCCPPPVLKMGVYHQVKSADSTISPPYVSARQ